VRQQSDLQELALFSKVAETKSFSAAARSFDTSTSAISKRVKSLERRLGVRLFERTTRRVALTDAGSTLYTHTLRILAHVAEAEDAVAEVGGSVRGTLRISAPAIYGERHVATRIPRLLAEHPDLRVELSLGDRFVNLAEEGFDCAVRIGNLADSSLVAIRIDEVDPIVCASPAYLARRGTPRTPHDLTAHDCIHFSLVPVSREWRFRERSGRELSVPVTGRFVLNSGSAMAAVAIAGAGIAHLPRFLVETAIARGDLVELLADFRTAPSPVHILHTSTTLVPPKLRAFVEMMRTREQVSAGNESQRASGRGAPSRSGGSPPSSRLTPSENRSGDR
jgi:DNA-binding transcriptional LysR family regulator